MKGVELLASLLALLMMIGIGAFCGGIIIYIINVAHQPSATPINYEMYLSPIYPPIKYETMLLSYLETNLSYYPIKKILTYAAYQRNITNIFMDGNVSNGNEEITNLGYFSSNVFNQWIPGETYLLILNVDGKEYVIVQNRRSLITSDMVKLRRISIPIYIDSFSIVRIDKTRELPLNVTLDFYVQ
jgi:hypothetical protein